MEVCNLSKFNRIFKKYSLKAILFYFCYSGYETISLPKLSESPSPLMRLSGPGYLALYRCEQELAVGCISEICISIRHEPHISGIWIQHHL